MQTRLEKSAIIHMKRGRNCIIRLQSGKVPQIARRSAKPRSGAGMTKGKPPSQRRRGAINAPQGLNAPAGLKLCTTIMQCLGPA
jgi:hypothetical protein